MSERVWIHTDGQCFATFTEDPKGHCSACGREGLCWALRWPRSPNGASPTGRQLGPGKRDELPPIVSEGVERDARIRELEGALEPFAEVVSGLRPDAQWDGDEPITGYFRVTDKRGEEFGYMDVTMNLAHFRRARSALSKATGEGE